MLSQLSKKNIKKKLSSIYRLNNSKKKLNVYADEIFQVIKAYNKFGKKGKKIEISEKTSVLICYGDSLLNGNKEKTIKIFRKFYKKKLDNDLINTIEFLCKKELNYLGYKINNKKRISKEKMINSLRKQDNKSNFKEYKKYLNYSKCLDELI